MLPAVTVRPGTRVRRMQERVGGIEEPVKSLRVAAYLVLPTLATNID